MVEFNQQTVMWIQKHSYLDMTYEFRHINKLADQNTRYPLNLDNPKPSNLKLPEIVLHFLPLTGTFHQSEAHFINPNKHINMEKLTMCLIHVYYCAWIHMKNTLGEFGHAHEGVC